MRARPLRLSCWLRFCLPAFLSTALAASDVADPSPAQGAPATGASAAAQDASAADGTVQVAADGVEATIEGSPFALTSFSRSQVGSNGEAGEGYPGYRYYVAGEPGSLVAIASEGSMPSTFPPRPHTTLASTPGRPKAAPS